MKNTTDHPTAEPSSPDPAVPDLAEPPIDRLLALATTLAVIIGVVLRFLPRSGLWLDEALSVNIANLAIGDIPSALRRDGHPPLFYVLLHVWNSLGTDSDWWARALSGVFSVLTLPLMYLAGRRIGEHGTTGPGSARAAGGDTVAGLGVSGGGLGARRTGLIAVAITALMPFGIRYAAEARMYSLVMALAAAGYLLVDDLLRARTTGRARVFVTLGAAVVAALLLWTHYWSMWLLAAVGIVALWRAWRETDPERRVGARLLVGALVAGGILFLPWISALLYQSQRTGTPWGEQFGPGSVIVITIVDFAGAKYGVAHLMTYVLVPLILLAAVAYIQRSDGGHTGDSSTQRRLSGTSEVGASAEPQQVVVTTRLVPRVRTELIVIALTMGIGWVTTFVSGNTFSSRYASGVFPLFVLCTAAGVAVLRRPAVTTVVLASILVMSLFGGLGVVRSDRSQSGELAQDILDDAAVSDTPAVVLACPDQLGVSLQRELEHRSGASAGSGTTPVGVVIPYPEGGDPRFIDWVDYGDRNDNSSPDEFLERYASRLPADATVYLVTSTTYRTFEGRCERLIALLAEDRDPTEVTSADDGNGLDEFASLWIFRPRS